MNPRNNPAPPTGGSDMKHPTNPDLLPVAPRDAAALRGFADAVRRTLGPRLVEMKLYGSKARGEDTRESDIDVLVVVTTADVETKNRVIDCAFQVNLEQDVLIAPVIVELSRVTDPVWHVTDLAIAVDREGITL